MKVLAKSWNHFQSHLFLRCIIDHDLHIPQTFPKILSEAVDILKQIILFTHFSEKENTVCSRFFQDEIWKLRTSPVGAIE